MTTLRPLIAMGGWITVGTVLAPALVSIDRFVIGSAVSVAAVTAYAAPYEVVTKLWIFSGSLMGVLFPRFSVLSGDREALRHLCRQGLVFLTLCTTPIAGLMVAFAPEFMRIWLGPEIARQGVVVARWLTIGVLINVIAQVPYTVLQATDHADATGKLQLMELPVYAFAAWFAALHWGVVGVAVVWGVRATVEAVLMFAAAWHRLGPIYARGAPATAGLVVVGSALLLVWCWAAVPVLTSHFIPKVLLVVLSMWAFIYLAARSLNVNLTEAALLLRG
jgi:O-antigen/teichoic acid export membrane protein